MNDHGDAARKTTDRRYIPRRDDRVSIPVDDGSMPGIVVEGDRFRTTVRLDDGREMVVLTLFVEPSDIPLPDHIKAGTFRRGDRVEFDHWSGPKSGVVVRGGKVALIHTDGRAETFEVSSGMLRHSSIPLRMDPPHPMDIWTITEYTHSDTFSRGSRAYLARIALDGVPMIQAIGGGRGDPARYAPIGSNPHSIIADLESAARQWLRDHGMPEHGISNAADIWVEWKAEKAPYGITAEDLIKTLAPDPQPTSRQHAGEEEVSGEWSFDEETYLISP